MSEAVDDMEAYTQLDDTVYHRILHYVADEKDSAEARMKMKEARKILENVQKRQLYKFIGEMYLEKDASEQEVLWAIVYRIEDNIIAIYEPFLFYFIFMLAV